MDLKSTKLFAAYIESDFNNDGNQDVAVLVVEMKNVL
jgi:hypothetical protein